MSSSIDSALARINRQSEEAGTKALADRLGLTYALLDDYPFSLDALRLVPFDTCRELMFATYVRTHDRLRVATVLPENAEVDAAILEIGQKLGLEIERTVVSASSFRHIVAEYARLIEEDKQGQAAAAAAAKVAERTNFVNHIHNLDELREQIETAGNVTDILDATMAAAYNQGASDVHIEPGQEFLVIRFRIDGVLVLAAHLPAGDQKQIISRIKMLSHLKIDEHGASQDGRFSLADKGMAADVRVSVIPTGYGEGVVMRLLRQDVEALSLEELGFSPHNLELIEKAIKKPYGMIVVTGPTGSGKSTTLYALLQKINSTEKKIITLEDPIEYKLEGVQQSQVNSEAGFSFAEGLRGALRQDPDVVMVGEIRDPETATIALNASLTGHLVLTTMHTNDAVTAPTRFLELGVEQFLLSGSINLIIAQRLVRVLQPGSTPEAPIYKGRVVIAECLTPNQEFEQGLQRHMDYTSLAQIAAKNGMVPMLQDGKDKVAAGVTSQSELERVTAV